MNKKNNKETVFRFPFDIDTRYVLGLAIVCFILSIRQVNESIFPKLTVPKLKEKIELDVSEKISQVNLLLRHQEIISAIYNQSLHKEQFVSLQQLPFSLYFFHHHQLVFWNSTLPCNPVDTFSNGKAFPFVDSSGYYIAYQLALADSSSENSVVALFKIKNDNGFQNEYFTKNFLVADKENDFNIDISKTEKPNSLPIIIQNSKQFYIYKNTETLIVHDKNGWRLFFRALFFILFGVSIHTYYKVEIKKKNTLLIFSLLLLTVFAVRIASYMFEFPNSFEEFGLFSRDYFSTDIMNRSLGDLFINMCLLFWILLFYIINVQNKVYDLRKSKYKKILGVLIFSLSLAGSLYLGSLIYRIMRDSVVNFDTTLYYKLDLFSFIGLLTYMVIFVNFFCISILSRNYLILCFKVKYIKYYLVLIGYLICNFCLPIFENEYIPWLVSLVIAAMYLLQDLNYLKTKFDFNSYKLLIWMLFISATGAFFLTLLIGKKEIKDREYFAESLLRQDENYAENKLVDVLNKIENDSALSEFVTQATLSDVSLTKYIKEKYFDEDNFQFHVDINIKKESNSSKFINNLSNRSFVQTISDENYVLYPSFVDKENNKTVLEIELSKSYDTHTNDYADLLLQRKNYSAKSDIYTYALYHENELTERSGNRVFLYKINSNEIPFDNNGKFLKTNKDDTELWLRNQDNSKRVVVVKSRNALYLFTTLFAYIFFIYFVTISLYILGNIIARSNLNYKRFVTLLGINLRLRIHLSILIVELISFLVIGYFTSYFLIKKVNDKTKEDLSTYSNNIQKEVKKLKPEKNYLVGLTSSDSAQKINYTNLMQDISERFSINLNLYSCDEGKLVFTSLPKLYNKKLLADRINPAVFFDLKNGSLNSIIRDENIGLLNYLSSYFLIRNSKGETMGIVQLPFFLSGTEIRSEKTTIITTLINIYIFVFLASAIIAFFLTKSVTRPFSYIVKQFTKINLSKTNEPLQWFDSDEIGLLIKEYNRMLRKLENSAVQIQKTEREMAWREMAKQVAHEIKNPLTPMKLSLQMLERAIKNNASNVHEMSIKVIKTLVEQIDNLTLIANDFSNFAKLPDAKKEVFKLNDFLYSITGMYHDDNNNEFLFIIPDYEISIYADKSQIIRVFTNIIQNAIQAIPEEKKGNIALTVSKIKNNHVRVSISDNGEGISAEKAKNLFQPYFTTKTSGTGLGLAMCKDIIEGSGGKISFESVVNEGTTFNIDLPIYSVEKAH